MVYRNTITGEVRNFTCSIKSNVWEAVETQSPIVVEKKQEEAPKKTVRKSTKKK